MRLISYAALAALTGCAAFQSRVDDRTRTLTTNSFDPVWNTELFELPANERDSAPSYEQFTDSGRYYCTRDWVIYEQCERYWNQERITSELKPAEWYANEFPRLLDSLHGKYPWKLKPFQGRLFLTGDTIWPWLASNIELEACAHTRTLAQLLTPGHWYLFVFDRDGRNWSDGGRYTVEQRVLFRIDGAGQVRDWRSTRRRVRKMRIV